MLFSFYLKAPTAASRVPMACGGATATRPVSNTVPTATPARERQEHVCAGQVTGGWPVRTVSVPVSPSICLRGKNCVILLLLIHLFFSLLLNPRMPSGDLRWPVWPVVPLLQPVLPLPPCDGRVRLPAGTHGGRLRSKWASSVDTARLSAAARSLHLSHVNLFSQFVQRVFTASSVPKCASTVPTTPRATTATATANVWRAGRRQTAPSVSVTVQRGETQWDLKKETNN